MHDVALAPQLTDGALTLRSWRTQDAAEIVRCCARDEEITRWLDAIPQPYTPQHARLYIRFTVDAWRDGTAAPFAIEDGTTGALLGSVSVRWVDRDARVAEVGYWIRAEARGRGVATRAATLVARYAFHELGAERLQLRAEAQNEASQRVAEKAGFTREGVLRSAGWSTRQGRRLDWVMYSLLPDELPPP